MLYLFILYAILNIKILPLKSHFYSSRKFSMEKVIWKFLLKLLYNLTIYFNYNFFFILKKFQKFGEYDVRMLIHQSLAGCIIGKGGGKIKEVRDVSILLLNIYIFTSIYYT